MPIPLWAVILDPGADPVNPTNFQTQHFVCEICRYAMTRQLTEKANIYSFGVVLLELFTGRNSIESGQKNIVSWATPRLSEDKFKQCIDPKLMEVYPPKAAAKLAAIAALCVQYEPEFRIDISRVVKTLELVLKESQAFVSAPAPAVI
ncbi:hypothetical protein RD792_015407 [Penstemon davidsonii]|uniref:Serine-threonine/tyrosine-protein kinase catalytic domain-containing protein n=1 Tax=Penstemon davidsonii TaxID=160366 RepID=A0ABR0CSW4_9LAMI|nr:hypothetical protein RD792_015407 [Penstemon davidsonii]